MTTKEIIDNQKMTEYLLLLWFGDALLAASTRTTSGYRIACECRRCKGRVKRCEVTRVGQSWPGRWFEMRAIGKRMNRL